MRNLNMVVYAIKGDPTSAHICSRFCDQPFGLCKQQDLPRRVKYGPYSFFYCERSNRVHLCGTSFCDRGFVVDEDGAVFCGLTGLRLTRQVVNDITRVLSHRARYDRPSRKKLVQEQGPSDGHWAAQVAICHWAWSGTQILCGCPPVMSARGTIENPAQVRQEEHTLKSIFRDAGRDALLLSRLVISTMLSSPQFSVVIQRRTKTIVSKAAAAATAQVKSVVVDAGHPVVFLPEVVRRVCHDHFPRGTITMDPLTFMRVVETLAAKVSGFWTQYFQSTSLTAEGVAALLYLSAEGWSSSSLVVKSNEFLATTLVPRRSLSLWGINPQSACVVRVPVCPLNAGVCTGVTALLNQLKTFWDTYEATASVVTLDLCVQEAAAHNPHVFDRIICPEAVAAMS